MANPGKRKIHRTRLNWPRNDNPFQTEGKRFIRCHNKVRIVIQKPNWTHSGVSTNFSEHTINSKPLKLQAVQNQALIWADVRHPNLPSGEHYRSASKESLSASTYRTRGEIIGKTRNLRRHEMQLQETAQHQSHKWWPRSFPLRSAQNLCTLYL